MFLRYQQISKKAVKLGSFFQCSVHTFLGHDGCFKNSFKNFVKPYHEELSRSMVNVTASYSPKHFLEKALSNNFTFALLTAGFFTFAGPGIYPQVYHGTPAVLKGV